MILTDKYCNSRIVTDLLKEIEQRQSRIHINGMTGSLPAVIGASLGEKLKTSSQLFIAGNKEDAYYFLNDLEALLNETNEELEKKRVLLFPTTYRRPYQSEEVDNANVLQRSEVVKQLSGGKKMLIVTYPEALCEKVISRTTLQANTLQIAKGAKLSLDSVMDQL